MLHSLKTVFITKGARCVLFTCYWKY